MKEGPPCDRLRKENEKMPLPAQTDKKNLTKKVLHWVLHDIPTLYSVFIILLLSVLASFALSFCAWIPRGKDGEGLRNIFEILVQVFNYIGVMLISRGVILLKDEELALEGSSKNAKKHYLMGIEIILNSSRWCRFGSLVISGAFFLDMLARIAMR